MLTTRSAVKNALVAFSLIASGVVLAPAAHAFEASFAGGVISQIEGDSNLLKDNGYKFLAVLNFPLQSKDVESVYLFDIMQVNGAAGSGVNSITALGADIGFEYHPGRGDRFSPMIGIFGGPAILLYDTGATSTNSFGFNAGAYAGASFKTGSLVFYGKALYEYWQPTSSLNPKNFTTLSFVGGVEIDVDLVPGL